MANYEDYFQKSRKSVFRYEGLQDYSAVDGGEEPIREFVLTGKLPFISSETEWWQDIKRKNEQGLKTAHVRLVTLPLTDYTKMELALHKNSADFSGEDIRVIEENAVAAIRASLQDFYLIDDRFLFLMEYGPKGKFISDRLVEGKEAEKYIQYKNDLIRASVPIAKYLEKY